VTQVSIPPVSARDGEPCPNCRAPLAGDQRYCLQCGRRRGDAPGTSLEALVAASAPGIAQTPGTAIVAGNGHVQLSPAPPQVLQGQLVPAGGGGGYLPPSPPTGTAGFIRSNGPFLSLGSLAVGVLIVGLLLGHWTSERGDVVAPTTTKIEITGLTAGAAAAPAATTAADTAADSADTASDDTASDDTAADTTPAAPPKDAVDAGKLTPAEIEKAGKKGKPIVTTGKKVPKDNKPAGGGSDFETIG
jgi:hypothetical protein